MQKKKIKYPEETYFQFEGEYHTICSLFIIYE